MHPLCDLGPPQWVLVPRHRPPPPPPQEKDRHQEQTPAPRTAEARALPLSPLGPHPSWVLLASGSPQRPGCNSPVFREDAGGLAAQGLGGPGEEGHGESGFREMVSADADYPRRPGLSQVRLPHPVQPEPINQGSRPAPSRQSRLPATTGFPDIPPDTRLSFNPLLLVTPLSCSG